MKRYDTYKDSGILWIGKIPSHWEVKPFGRYFSFGKGLPITKADLQSKGIAVISYGQIHAKNNSKISISDDLVRFVSDNFLKTHPQCLLSKDAFVFADTSEDIEGSGNFAFNNRNTPIFAGYHTIIACPKGLHYPLYYALLFQSINWKAQIQSLVNGVKVFSIGKGILKKAFLLAPPLNEQQAIADYLKDKTSKIDKYIAQREKEVVLLEELKQSEIANAVTKGLNPNVPMKDSGIAWMGMIPKHWDVLRAKNMFRKEKREVRDTDEVITCFRDGQVTLRKNRRTSGFTESFTEYGYQGVRKGDLVIHQMDAFAGAIGVSDSDGKGTSVYHCCTPKGDYNVYYYAFLLKRMAQSGYIQSLYRGIRERSSDFKFPVFGVQYLLIPPISEQQAIVDYIDTHLAKIDKCISDLKSEIEHLKEFKQRLISDVVTGQIKVID